MSERSAEGWPEGVSHLVVRNLFDGGAVAELGQFRELWSGVEILPLYGRAPDGRALSPTLPSAAILRYAPGAEVPEHEHRGFEHIVVLSGSQEDARGRYPGGTCVINPPGTRHAVRSNEGCMVLAIWNRPVEVLRG